ncbi:MAG: tetratricopeptide repeat protein [Candidatus Bathyarchaeia archaeon]
MEPGLGEPWYYAGVAFLDQQKWQQAYEMLEQALMKDSGLAKAYIAQARVMAFGYGNYDEARTMVTKGIQLGSQDEEVLIEAGRFYLDISDSKQAEQILRSALTLKPGDLYILVDLGRSLFAQERFAEALEIFKQASLIPTGDWQEAVAHAWLGSTYIACGKVNEALQEFKLAAQLHPADSDNFVRLGDAYRLIGDNEKALEAYQRALSINPGNERVLRGILDLQEGK